MSDFVLPGPCFDSETLSTEERHGLILQHLPQVRLLARKIHARLPENVSLDDLVSTGIVGLISAIDRFDPSRHIQLRTYAQHKIKGGILDGLRRLDWAPRDQRKRAKQVEAAIAAAEQRWHRAPTEQEVADELHVTVDRYRKWRANAHGMRLGSLSVVLSEDSEDQELLHFVSADPHELPSAVLERGQLKRALATAISRLPEIHKTVLSLYYRDELKPREIGKIIGLQECRVCQIKRQAIHRLRACMAKLWPTGGSRYCSN